MRSCADEEEGQGGGEGREGGEGDQRLEGGVLTRARLNRAASFGGRSRAAGMAVGAERQRWWRWQQLRSTGTAVGKGVPHGGRGVLSGTLAAAAAAAPPD